MKKIKITVEKDFISFSICYKDIEEFSLNNTNVIDVNNLTFSDLYIVNNMELVGAFLNVILIKSNIKKLKIKNFQISEIVVELIKQIPSIEYIFFDYDKQLTYSITESLIENKNIKYINCFSIPEVMLGRFNNKKIQFRCEMLFISDFMNVNKIHSYSGIFFKKIIIYNCEFNQDDINDFLFFLKINDKLKLINVINYKKEPFKKLLNYLDENNEHAQIIIYEDKQNPGNVLNDITELRRIKDKKKYDIKIKYSKEYKEKNLIKQLNLNFFKLIILSVIIMTLTILIFYTRLKKKTNDSITEINNEIQDVVENYKINSEKSNTAGDTFSYYTNYDKVFSKLLEINSETVGWITVPSTNVNYPVVQTKDNKYYLNHDYKKNNNSAGWIYVDYRNDLTNLDKNTIIYGHNVIGSNILFSTLKNTLDEKWLKKKNNHYIEFNTTSENVKWEIFSIYLTDVTDEYLITKFSTESSYEIYIEKEKNKSIHDFNVNVKANDKILTLSTCYNDSKKRLVIHAKKI